MTVRLPALLVLVATLWGLLNASITVPALTVVGLVAWAVFATALAAVLAVDRHRGIIRPPRS